jgi:phosphoribosyl 1,2-cyclic phosphodiesterase
VQIFPIASSSEANSTWIKTNEASILIDGGTTLKKISSLVENPDKLDAMFITHEHGDHIKGAGAIGRKYKTPIYIHEYSYNVKRETFNKCTINFLQPSQIVKIKDLEVFTFSTRHDCRNSFGFLISQLPDGPRFCYLTDTGLITQLMLEKVKKCNVLLIEADYDEDGLKKYADYSEELKERISSNFGHLSNKQAIDLVKKLDLDKMKLVIFGHLSARTNSPDILMDQLAQAFPGKTHLFKLAPTTKPIEVL